MIQFTPIQKRILIHLNNFKYSDAYFIDSLNITALEKEGLVSHHPYANRTRQWKLTLEGKKIAEILVEEENDSNSTSL